MREVSVLVLEIGSVLKFDALSLSSLSLAARAVRVLILVSGKVTEDVTVGSRL